MKLKRYLVDDVRQALDTIKHELGPDAVIIQTRAVKPNGMSRLWRRSRLEVLAAAEDAPPVRREARPPEPLRPAWPAEETGRLRQIEERLDAMARSLDAISALGRAAVAPASGSPSLTPELQRLVEHGLSADIAGRVRESLGQEGRGSVSGGLRRLLPPCAQLTLSGQRPDVIVFLGTTGVGKTTTLAKVAAELKLRHGKRVALATIDTFRVAAVQQLEIYADLLDVPLRVAYEPEELRQTVRDCGDYDVVLLDTPGRSPADERGLDELRRYLEAVPQARRLLLLEAGSHLADLRRVARALGADRCDGLVLTKADETEVHGAALSYVIEAGLPVHYITTGQNVPQDIEPASPDGLVALVTGLGDAGESREAAGREFVRLGARELARSFSGGQAW